MITCPPWPIGVTSLRPGTLTTALLVYSPTDFPCAAAASCTVTGTEDSSVTAAVVVATTAAEGLGAAHTGSAHNITPASANAIDLLIGHFLLSSRIPGHPKCGLYLHLPGSAAGRRRKAPGACAYPQMEIPDISIQNESRPHHSTVRSISPAASPTRAATTTNCLSGSPWLSVVSVIRKW